MRSAIRRLDHGSMDRCAFVEVGSKTVALRIQILPSRSPYVLGRNPQTSENSMHHFLIAEQHQKRLPEVRVRQTSFIGHCRVPSGTMVCLSFSRTISSEIPDTLAKSRIIAALCAGSSGSSRRESVSQNSYFGCHRTVSSLALRKSSAVRALESSGEHFSEQRIPSRLDGLILRYDPARCRDRSRTIRRACR